MPLRKRVLWDERNLEANEEYRRQHPVTMHISEPKTPYVHAAFDEEGNFVDGSRVAEAEEGERQSSTWDPKINALARQMKEGLSKQVEGPLAPVTPSGRPMLSPGVTNGDVLAKRHAMEFKTMRRAVYADEGATFKALLARKYDDDDDDEKEEDREKGNGGGGSDGTADSGSGSSKKKKGSGGNGEKNVQ
ncbi:Protein phosphatase inhibitor 2 (IPP-2) [Trypanosoma melophagium]|uniref:Protein phosphatase inhibitor 2 (IPP-2) n=1 Tax=Trypanosoma melophagium TaxID=715481 RepID=UPI00351A91DC|nr:Protein phosphatase inhibitor 2 (IPP-2) [Trypanosoma melophagium]